MESLDLSKLFGGTYAGRRVLVTGHTGFKGSWLVLWLHSLGAEIAGLALPPDTSPSHWELLDVPLAYEQIADLRDAESVRAALLAFSPEVVFHLAAQPLVRRSYQDPVTTFSSNVMGLVNLLEAVRACPSVRVLVNVTTDKVYAEHPSTSGYRERDPLGGHDPYSSSKACAELVSECYRKSFFSGDTTRIATARAGNVIGGGDWAEDRLVPDLVRAASSGQALLIRNPSAIRPWQHVLEPLSGYLRLGQRLWDDGNLAGAWNFGPGANGEVSVQVLVERLGRNWNALRIERDGMPQPHEAASLRLDPDKAQRKLGWRPVWNIDTALARTADWYRSFHDGRQTRSNDDLDTYVRDAKSQLLEWAQ